jgi:hypothetical protein
MQKFMLGILGLVLIFSVVLGGFTNFDVANQDSNEEAGYVLEPTQPEAEPKEPEPAQAEPVPETEAEPTWPEPVVVEASPPLEVEVQEPDANETETTPETEPETEHRPEPETNQTEPIPPTPLIQQNYSAPVSNAIDFFKTSTEPEAMLWLDLMNRRFGIVEFANAMEYFDQLLYWFPEKSYVRMFRRMGDYKASINVAELKRVTNEVDVITLPALYCDRLDFPANYSTLLEEGVNNGGYQLTHVLLAWIWIQENGGEIELPDGFVEDMYQANAALINTDSTVTDLEMEAAAFLCLAGQSELVDDSFVDCVIASQAVDGSWGGIDKRWHTTVLGLLYLLHMEFPSDSYPPVLAPNTA